MNKLRENSKEKQINKQYPMFNKIKSKKKLKQATKI